MYQNKDCTGDFSKSPKMVDCSLTLGATELGLALNNVHAHCLAALTIINQQFSDLSPANGRGVCLRPRRRAVRGVEISRASLGKEHEIPRLKLLSQFRLKIAVAGAAIHLNHNS